MQPHPDASSTPIRMHQRGGGLRRRSSCWASCSPPAEPQASGSPIAQPSSSATGGTLRIGIGGSTDSLNPGLALLSEAFELFELVYDTPLAITPRASTFRSWRPTGWSPMTASPGPSPSATTSTFHDGDADDREDVAVQHPAVSRQRGLPVPVVLPGRLRDGRGVDATHVEIVTSEPIGNMEYRLLFMYVLPKHIWENEDPLTFENAEMIGTGPFKLVEFESEVVEHLAANEDYYAGRPIIDEVIFQTISNADARVAALTNGDIDLLTEFPVTAIANLRNAENVEVFISEIAAGGSFTDIIFNVLDDENCPPDDPETEEADGGVCSGHPALKDVEVRQALAMATNKQEFIDVTWLGEAGARPGARPERAGRVLRRRPRGLRLRPEAAAQMLEDAGYVDENGDGIRECKASDQDCDDLTFRLNYATDSDTVPARGGDPPGACGARWASSSQIQGLDADTLTSVCCPAFDYDVLIWGWGSDPDPQFLQRRPALQRDHHRASARPATATRSTTSCTPRRAWRSITRRGPTSSSRCRRSLLATSRTSSRTTRGSSSPSGRTRSRTGRWAIRTWG